MSNYQIGLWRWVDTFQAWQKLLPSRDEIVVRRLSWSNNPAGEWQVIVPLPNSELFSMMIDDPHRGMAIADAVWALR